MAVRRRKGKKDRKKKKEGLDVQFSGRTRPKKGIFSVCLAAACILLLAVMVVLSTIAGGNGGWYIGAGGMLALALAALGFFLAVRCFSMEDIYYGLPVGGAFFNGVLLLGCLALYVVGFV